MEDYIGPGGLTMSCLALDNSMPQNVCAPDPTGGASKASRQEGDGKEREKGKAEDRKGEGRME